MKKPDKMIEYVEYMGRQVPRDGFRVYVYHEDGSQKLVNSYKEYSNALLSGEWFVTKEESAPKPKKREKLKDDANS